MLLSTTVITLLHPVITFDHFKLDLLVLTPNSNDI